MTAGKPQFPLPFASLRTLSGEGASPYIAGAMFTAAYAENAMRLAASCAKFSLSYELHEVPTVHRSISLRGSDDLRFTKANFIHHLLTTHKRPVLYLDADLEIVAQPALLSELVRDRIDFAIYNWLADEHNDRFYPVNSNPPVLSLHRLRRRLFNDPAYRLWSHTTLCKFGCGTRPLAQMASHGGYVRRLCGRCLS